jgi:hypothetical protein
MKPWIMKQWKHLFMALAALIAFNNLLLTTVLIEEGARTHSVAQIAQEDILKMSLSKIAEATATATASATRKRSIEDKLAGLNCDAHGGPVETRQIFNRESGEVFSRSRMWLEDQT